MSATEDPVVVLLFGPNLNLLGAREPHIYGTETLDDVIERARVVATSMDLCIEAHQSNHEGELIDHVHHARGRVAAIIVNPGALTHYGWGLHDALASYDGAVVEYHLSNPMAREAWRHTSVISPVADAVLVGLGPEGIDLAVRAAATLIERDRKAAS